MPSIRLLFSCAVIALTASAARAQPLSGWKYFAVSQERDGTDHLILRGQVELEREDTKLYADQVEVFRDTNRAVASGNVVFTQGRNTIAADHADFDTETRLGVFRNAYGIANIKPPPRSAGLAVPPMAGQENDVYFYGERVEKIGPKKYRITNGGFTTCVQPTPRWELSAGSVVLNVDDYTLLRNAVFSVKGVPLLYVPLLYYPTNDEGRATGFLIPTYGTSTIRGQNISNAFFWAIDRSHDATFFHDWFSRTGQGVGSEYRYNLGAGDGSLRAYLLEENETVYALADGTSRVQPGSRSYEIRGGASQLLPGNLRARARVDYFSSIATMQTFNTNVYDLSRSQRSVGGNVVGAWGTYSLNGTFDRSEYFYNATDSTLNGSTPRVSFSRNERPLFRGSPLYFSAGTEYVHLTRHRQTSRFRHDSSLSRLDITPQIRYPFKRWQWFTVNSSLAWRDTFYTRSLDPAIRDPVTGGARIVDDGVNRRFFTMQAQAVGPVFNRVWNTPDNRYAERFKHTIEPFLNVQRASSIDNYERIVQTDGVDGFVGNVTSYTYGVNNRLYAKRRVGQTSRAEEILSVALTQSYYTNALQAQYDRQYSTGIGGPPSRFSPLALSVRATPSSSFNARLSAEFDSRKRELRTLSADGSYSWANRLQATAGWSQRYFIEGLPGFDNPNALDHYLNVSTSLRTPDARFGGVYAINYDLLRSRLMQQRMSGFYNAQCCGIAFEYQTFNLSGIGAFGIPADRRFFLSFTLAGLGNFSPFNGAMGAIRP
jgi:LPS-assembly protein